MVLFAGYNFFFGIAGVLVQPLILSFSSPDTLGMLMFASEQLFAGQPGDGSAKSAASTPSSVVWRWAVSRSPCTRWPRRPG